MVFRFGLEFNEGIICNIRYLPRYLDSCDLKMIEEALAKYKKIHLIYVAEVQNVRATIFFCSDVSKKYKPKNSTPELSEQQLFWR